MWYFQGSEFTSEDIGSFVGFVYEITDKKNNKKYIGKKNFWTRRRLKPLRGKSRRRVQIAESDWKDYYGSNEELKGLVEKLGADNFHREILLLCRSKGEMTYYEMKYQIDNEVLFREDYYNEFIGGKIHSKHVKK